LIMQKDQLEFAISQYLDGTLPAEEIAALEQVLASDVEAKGLLEQYRKLDELLKREMVVPVIDQEKLSQAISAGIDHQQTGAPVNEATEFAITLYLDGELSADERAAMEQRLAVDPAARRVAGEYAALDRIIKRAMPLPNLNWDRVSQEISQAVDEVTQRQRYSLVWLRQTAKLAMAACILIAIGVGAMLLLNRGTTHTSEQRIARVEVPRADQPTAPQVAQISIGAMNDVADSSYSSAQVIGRESPRLSITMASACRDAQENPFLQ